MVQVWDDIIVFNTARQTRVSDVIFIVWRFWNRYAEIVPWPSLSEVSHIANSDKRKGDLTIMPLSTLFQTGVIQNIVLPLSKFEKLTFEFRVFTRPHCINELNTVYKSLNTGDVTYH